MTTDRTSSVDTKLEVRDLHVWYGKRHAVRGVNFAVADRKTVAFIGATGSGRSATPFARNPKTTFSNAVSGRVAGWPKIIPTRRRSAATSVPAPSASAPSILMLPSTRADASRS